MRRATLEPTLTTSTYVYEFEDGMARRVRSYIDPDRARAAVGLPPTAA
jgi:hypothetical protein